jgi:hypothetical protein
VHLVGSPPLASNEDVFRLLAARLGDRLCRIADGETDDALFFAGWQVSTFARHPDVEPVKGRRLLEVVKPQRLRAGVDPASLRFSDLGFAAAAMESYAVSRRLRSEKHDPSRRAFSGQLADPRQLPRDGRTQRGRAGGRARL